MRKLHDGALKQIPRRGFSFAGYGVYGQLGSGRRNVWQFSSGDTLACWGASDSPRHDRHVTPYDPRAVIPHELNRLGITGARPGPIARFRMSRVGYREGAGDASR